MYKMVTMARIESKHELDNEDKFHIMHLFHTYASPRLTNLDARIGMLNCDFAGEQYRHWNLRFRSRGESFEIVDFEYDEESHGFSLEP